MNGTYKRWKNIALSAAVAAGMAMFAVPARAANSQSQPEVRSAQQQLKSDGYYSGRVDGVEGPMTRRAIRDFQRDNNLQINGNLDRQTRSQLGIGVTGEANREMNENSGANQGSQSDENSQRSYQNRQQSDQNGQRRFQNGQQSSQNGMQSDQDQNRNQSQAEQSNNQGRRSVTSSSSTSTTTSHQYRSMNTPATNEQGNNGAQNDRNNQGTANRSENGNSNMSATNGNMNSPANANVSSAQVESAQRRLQQKGLYNGTVDGVMGPQTQSAIRQFQRDNNLPATGQLNQKTLQSLGVSNQGSKD